MIKRMMIFLCMLSIFMLSEASAAVNSATITLATMKALPHCIHYRIRGVCYWANWLGVINTTSYIEQYLPDVVISVFEKPDDNQWTEINATLDQAGQVAEKEIVSSLTGLKEGEGQHSFSNVHEQNVFFKEVDVIGNPALATLPSEGFLPSTATPLMPYYQSMLDSAMWRGLPQARMSIVEETYAAMADLTHHLGTGVIDWGGVYPHEGKVATSNDAKAAAVVAQRAGDLITSSNFAYLSGHIYHGLSNQCGEACDASPIQENSSKTQFQMIYPVEEDDCDYFGKIADYGNDIETKTHGNYVWIVWRFYSGCTDGDGKYLGKILID